MLQKNSAWAKGRTPEAGSYVISIAHPILSNKRLKKNDIPPHPF
jgi:hypothetical protein